MSGHGFIAAAARTPIGSFQGSLAALTAPALGAHAIRAVLPGIDPAGIDEVIFGNVISAGLKQAPARQAMRLAGLPDACGATTINKVCGSGMKAVMLAHDRIRAGSANAVICGGMESMTNAPYLLMRARSGLRMGHGELKDAMFLDGLEDADTGASMGSFAEATASARQISREAMDAYALESVLRARRAIEQRSLAGEISPLSINGTLVTDDEPPGRARPERIPALKPAFKADGAVTAANSSSISDGASALPVTLAHGLIRTGGKRGIASLCIGGGEATAVALERV